MGDIELLANLSTSECRIELKIGTDDLPYIHHLDANFFSDIGYPEYPNNRIPRSFHIDQKNVENNGKFYFSLF